MGLPDEKETFFASLTDFDGCVNRVFFTQKKQLGVNYMLGKVPPHSK